MNKTYLLLIALLVYSVLAFAQKELNILDIEILNLGDGQRFVHERGNRDNPVEGKVRIITGMSTEYIDAEIKAGYAEGKWDYYANNRLRESLQFSNGYMEGKQILYFGNGDVEREASFKKGMKHGDWVHYNRDGGRRELEVFVDGGLTKRITYYSNGNVGMERNFKNGKEDGVTKTYTQEGELKSEKHFINGKQVGKEMSLMTSNNGQFFKHCNYNEKGNLDGDYLEEWAEIKKPKAQGKYINGQKDGLWKEWYANGEIRREEVYKNGERVNN